MNKIDPQTWKHRRLNLTRGKGERDNGGMKGKGPEKEHI